MMDLEVVSNQLRVCLDEYIGQGHAKSGTIFVVGCSTSEVAGERIGTAGTFEVAETLYNELTSFAKQTGVNLAFQCCEHLNRALVVERALVENTLFEEVTVVPAQHAGGALATYAYKQMNDPVVVEFILANGGIDIGDTFIGMHIKHVLVPVRTSVKEIGQAHVTLATSRPKLIGGERAIYQ